MRRELQPRCVAWTGILCLTALLAAAQCVGAAEKPKDFPNHPITIIVPGPAGGISDVGVRIMGESLKKLLGQAILVENKPGAAGQIAYTDFKNNAKPDGYTISQVSSPHIHAIVLDTTRPGCRIRNSSSVYSRGRSSMSEPARSTRRARRAHARSATRRAGGSALRGPRRGVARTRARSPGEANGLGG